MTPRAGVGRQPPRAGEGVEISDRPRFVLRSKQGSFELSEGESLVGRSRNCQVVVRDPSVSRSHALLTFRDGVVRVKDLSSSNGTYVN
ncbi:MAG: FHA domain-containing protein, partial [Acidobacteria bacterium]|nr:FHA domain-containing protein [Acidobacteriota bacterium]